ncbi:hypothetical protein A1351_06155 [Methylosinus sp. R-45379]|uniref:hypothetical protein n=1 Tax=unclassified Methylosinus TaxID=2624500 RepID=UPI00046527B5|nr:MULTISPECIES: hypothetical protein [unclassified Methylosinus]OAI31229.1 hypothetical protein A1351_06155 [Methylosinus sp. R-45379]
MIPRRAARARAFWLALATTLPAAEAAGCGAGDPSLVGHYYLSGVMETGSELLLRPDGRFDYMLAYGALDEIASGCWSRQGDVVTLAVSKFQASMDDPMKFDRLALTVTPRGGLSRRFEGGRTGVYSRPRGGR